MGMFCSVILCSFLWSSGLKTADGGGDGGGGGGGCEARAACAASCAAFSLSILSLINLSTSATGRSLIFPLPSL